MAISLTLEEQGAGRIMRWLSKFPRIFETKLHEEEHNWALIAASRVRAIAPRDTGYYADVTIKVSGNTAFTGHPAANRLENGFVGIDSLGRHYTQMPRPHWSIVREQMREEFPKAVGEILHEEIRHGADI